MSFGLPNGKDAIVGSGLNGGALTIRGGQSDGAGIDGPIILLLRDAATGGAIQASALGNARGRSAIDLQVGRTAVTQVASGAFSSILGGYAGTASGAYAAVVGGQTNTASGIVSAVAGGSGHVASGNGSFIGGGTYGLASGGEAVVLGGYYGIASGQFSSTIGGDHNTASGKNSGILAGKLNIASGDYSAVLGGQGNTASGKWSMVIGHRSKAKGVNCVAMGGGSNYSEGDGTFTAGGQYGHAQGVFSVVIGSYYSCLASGAGAAIVGSYYAVASGKLSSILGGRGNTVSGTYGAVVGSRRALSDRQAELSRSSGRADATVDTRGQTQTGYFDLQVKSLTNVVTELLIGEAGTVDHMILRPSTTWQFQGMVTGRRTAGAGTAGDTATFFISGAIRRDAANNTALVAAATITAGPADVGAATWAVTVTADDVNESLKITGAGDVGAGVEVYWHASLWVSESGLGA